MAEAPSAQKRKHVDPVGVRKRHRSGAGVDTTPAESARSLGGVAVFKSAWAALKKAGWTSKKPSTKCLDSRYKYIRPGGRSDGIEGDDFLLGELAVLRYVEEVRVPDAHAPVEELKQRGMRRTLGLSIYCLLTVHVRLLVMQGTKTAPTA